MAEDVDRCRLAPGRPSRATLLRVVRRCTALAAACCLALAVAAVAVLAGTGHAPGPRRDEWRIRLVKRTAPQFDRYTDAATPRVRAWMNDKLWRAVVFSPYFDDKTAWFPHGWSYRNLYGIPVGSGLARRHPGWILRDGHGRRLYLQFGCSGGRCAQYAGDIANPAFRRHWIAEARRALARGYTGLWIDDVNLEVRVSDGRGRTVLPVRHGRRMTPAGWRDAVATFVTVIRRALPRAEIVHNAIWFAGGARRQDDPAVRREIQAADVINLERGVNDAGLTGAGEWSVDALLRYVDAVHALGRSVVFEGVDPSDEGREYNLAAELLATDGRDAVGISDTTPDDFWAPYGFDLGPAQGAREVRDGVLVRRFARGLVLLNPPGAPARTVALDGEHLDIRGRRVGEVRLGAARGAVLRTA
jgi:hypothetical protein